MAWVFVAQMLLMELVEQVLSSQQIFFTRVCPECESYEIAVNKAKRASVATGHRQISSLGEHDS